MASHPSTHPDSGSTSRRFRAPWSGSLRASTSLVLLILAAVLVLVWAIPDPEAPGRPWWVSGLIGALVLVTPCFMVRGYEVTPEGLRILRPGWSTSHSWACLDSVEFNPGATRHSWRLFGIGGFFVYSGWFWNRDIGTFKLHGNHRSLCVTLKFGHSYVIVTPDPPFEFVDAVEKMAWPQMSATR